MEKIIKNTYSFAEQYHSNDKSGHDFTHIKRVYNNAINILKYEKQADYFIVVMSALLHDVDDRKLNTDGKNTLRFLETLNLDNKVIKEILKTIDAISFSKNINNPNLETLEMKIVSDSDKLDAIGAVGICRTLIYGASKQNCFFDEKIFPIENITKEQYLANDKENTSINHFFDKLLKLKSLMKTETGKQIAEKRHDFMILFLQQFFEEQNLDNWSNYLNNYILNYN